MGQKWGWPAIGKPAHLSFGQRGEYSGTTKKEKTLGNANSEEAATEFRHSTKGGAGRKGNQQVKGSTSLEGILVAKNINARTGENKKKKANCKQSKIWLEDFEKSQIADEKTTGAKRRKKVAPSSKVIKPHRLLKIISMTKFKETTKGPKSGKRRQGETEGIKRIRSSRTLKD